MKLINLLFCTTIFSSTWFIIESARILGVFPMGAKSHYILGSALCRELAERGHDVTVISAFGEKIKPKNGTYRDIVLSGLVQSLTKDRENFNLFDMANMNVVIYMVFMNFMGNTLTEFTFNHTDVQNLIKSKDEHFDVVIVEQFINDAHKVFAYHFNAPLVLFGTFGSNNWLNPLVGNPAPPSYVPEQMINFSLNFYNRLKNNILYILGELNRHFLFFPQQNKIMKKYFPIAPDLNVLNYNASLVFLNSHISTNQPVPRVPNMIDIGGFHVKPPKKLPEDLQKFLDSAKDGVIYFSMGSNLRSAQLPLEKREALLKAFSKLKEKVLWKWEEDELPGQPANVKINKWLPQQDILAHPNIKLFITHGGLLSIIETVYHGVPILAIPIFGDQQINAADAELNGYALSLPYNEVTEEKLSKKINELLYDPKYRENVKKRSRLFHDRPNKPMDTAVFWIEYIIRHQGGSHLRVAALDLTWYQYLSLDVCAFLTLIIIFIAYFIYLLLTRKICRKMCKRHERKATTKDKPTKSKMN